MSAKELAAYVHDQLRGLPGVSSRAMMGGYVFYYRERIFGGIYEAGFLLKNTPAARAALQDAEETDPYPGGRKMLSCTILDDSEALQALVEAMYDELPPPKPKKKRTKPNENL